MLLGIDVGTGSTKGLLCWPDGSVAGEATIDHEVERPMPGWAEQDAEAVWWSEVAAVARRLTGAIGRGDQLAAVGVSGLGPCLLPVDAAGRPLRRAILYGIDTRAGRQIEAIEGRHGREAIFGLGGMRLSSQSVGPKIAWLREEEPDVYRRTARFLSAPSYLVFRLTGQTALDRHTASYLTPLFDIRRLSWSDRFAEGVLAEPADLARLPPIRASDEVAGAVTAAAAEATGIPAGTPVLVGSSDTIADAESAGVIAPGDALLTYGTTAVVLLVTDRLRPHPDLWATVGAPGGHTGLTAGLASAGAAVDWSRATFLPGSDDEQGAGLELLAAEAEASPPGARGVVVLPYLAGERSPLQDPGARGLIAGLTLSHRRGDVYRAVLEGLACAVRHNLETMAETGAQVRRIVAVGGGTKNRTWLRIESSVLGREQLLPVQSGAAYGDALRAGLATGIAVGDWVRIAEAVAPDPAAAAPYDDLYGRFRALYPATRDIIGALGQLAGTG